MFRRSSGIQLETLAAQPSLDEFAGQQAAVINTIQSLGFPPDGAVFIGSAALAAAYGLNAIVNRTTLDVDAVVSEPTFKRLQGMPGAESCPIDNPISVDVPGAASLLPVTGIRTPLTEGLARHLRATTFQELSARTTTVNGIPVLSPADLAQTKIGRGDLNDCAGIIKAHLIAYMTEHPVATDPGWQQAVVSARNTLRSGLATRRFAKKELPGWLAALTASRFDHAALATLSSDTSAVMKRRAS